ncbi:tail protein X [Salmonella enterica subsp. enterica serovar Weltevreden]|nr:tail protein X [Salmonella enterica subsp. enterica serovar Weltevreden]
MLQANPGLVKSELRGVILPHGTALTPPDVPSSVTETINLWE